MKTWESTTKCLISPSGIVELAAARLACILFLVVLGQRRLLCLGKAPCCRQQDKASKRKIQRDDSCCRSGSVLFFCLLLLFQSSWVGWRFSWMFLCPPLCYRRLMLKRSSRGPTEMRGSWAHKGITARSRAKPVALEKGVRGGSDGGTRRNGWNEKKGFGAATIPCKTAYGKGEKIWARDYRNRGATLRVQKSK